MNKSQHNRKTQSLNPGIAQSEVDRKWRRYQEEMEMIEIMESARSLQAVAAVSSSAGGGSISSDVITLVTGIDGDFGATVVSSTGYVGVVWWDSSNPEIFGDGNPESYPTFFKANDGTPRKVTFYSCDANGFRIGTMSYLSAIDNNISEINLSNCFSLNLIELSFNNLTALDVSSCLGLNSLSCSNNSITTLGTLPASLTELQCGRNLLTVLNVSHLVNLIVLTCYHNNLTALNVSHLVNLITLNCYRNNLTTLDVSALVNLVYLYCHTNPITSLDFSNCTSLQLLQSHHCQLTSINSFAATAGSFSFETNQLSASALDSFFTSLGIWSGPINNYIGVSVNPGTATCNTSIATSKGWEVHT